jgi:glycosyltransferase involved in cell wall biosynthesis
MPQFTALSALLRAMHRGKPVPVNRNTLCNFAAPFMKFPSSSLIVSTYNRPDALLLCLESVFRQKHLPNEIVIADDGSREETRQLIESLKSKSPVPVVHVWQPDDGYQLARIRNRAFAAASFDYIIQVDGDLVLDPHFVYDHLSMCRPGTFISGSRTMIDETLTQQLLRHEVSAENITRQRKHLDKRHNSVRSAFLRRASYLFQRNPANYKYVLGCNMAFWKKDLLAVNGYNETFKGWGKEDNELAVRLQNAGIKLRFIKFGAVVFHLHHKVADLSAVPSNEEKLLQTIANKITVAPSGMDQFLGK